MIKRLLRAYKGKCEWKRLKRMYRINKETVVIVLPEEDSEWNMYALKYLSFYMNRKDAKNAYVLVAGETEYKNAKCFENKDIKVVKYKRSKMDDLLNYYCFDYFFDNICFFYLIEPRDNYSSKLLEEGDIDKETLIYLSFYGLRVVGKRDV